MTTGQRWGWSARAGSMETTVASAELAFDVVMIEGRGFVSPEEFLAVPLDERIKLRFGNRLRFYRHGQTVEADAALKSLLSATRARYK